MSQHTYVIADIGANHDGDLSKMHGAVRGAKAAGADAIKFQWTSDPDRMAARRGRASADGYADTYRRYLHFPLWVVSALYHLARSAELDFMCTVFLPEDVEVIAPYVAKFKVASFESRDPQVLLANAKAASDHGKPLVVSCGMQYGNESQELLRDLVGYAHMPETCWMHCVSAYPAPADQLNLAVLRHTGLAGTLSRLGEFTGLSDHTDPRDTWTGALAVAAGAQAVEAHLRLDTTDPANPDYPHAMTVEQFETYVRHIRFAETCLGDGVKQPQPCEAAMSQYLVKERKA